MRNTGVICNCNMGLFVTPVVCWDVKREPPQTSTPALGTTLLRTGSEVSVPQLKNKVALLTARQASYQLTPRLDQHAPQNSARFFVSKTKTNLARAPILCPDIESLHSFLATKTGVNSFDGFGLISQKRKSVSHDPSLPYSGGSRLPNARMVSSG